MCIVGGLNRVQRGAWRSGSCDEEERVSVQTRDAVDTVSMNECMKQFCTAEKQRFAWHFERTSPYFGLLTRRDFDGLSENSHLRFFLSPSLRLVRMALTLTDGIRGATFSEVAGRSLHTVGVYDHTRRDLQRRRHCVSLLGFAVASPVSFFLVRLHSYLSLCLAVGCVLLFSLSSCESENLAACVLLAAMNVETLLEEAREFGGSGLMTKCMRNEFDSRKEAKFDVYIPVSFEFSLSPDGRALGGTYVIRNPRARILF